MCYEGVTKSIGVSNYTQDHLEELLQYCRFKPAVLQVIHVSIYCLYIWLFCFLYNGDNKLCLWPSSQDNPSELIPAKICQRNHSLSPWHLPFNRVPTYLERQEESGNWGGQGRVWELCWWSWKNSMVADCATVAVILCQARSIMSYITYKLLTLHNWNCKQLCKVKVSTLLIVPTEWISSTLA